MTAYHRCSRASAYMIALLLLFFGWEGSARGQAATQGDRPAAAAEQPQAEQPADPLGQSRKRHLELAIAIAADFDSPAQQQAASVVAQQELVDARFDAPVRAALAADKDGGQPRDDQRIAAAIAMLKHTTIESKDQISLLLDLLIARSLNENSQEGRELRQGRLQRNLPGIANVITSRLHLLPEALVEVLEARLAQDQPPIVLYGAAGFAGERGATLVPKLLAVAAESDDRFVKAAVFQSVEHIFEADREHRLRVGRDAAANSAARRPSVDELNALADRTNLSRQILEFAARIIQRNDRTGDGVLTKNEWAGMLVDPSPADTNQDGRVTVEEYAAWMQSRSSR